MMRSLHRPLADAVRRGGLQTPGLMLTAAWLLLANPRTPRAAGQGFGEMFSSGAENLEEALPLLNVGLAIAGAIIGAVGLVGIVRAVRSPQQGGIGGPLTAVIMGAGLISLPWLIGQIVEGFGGTASGGVGFSKPAFN